MKTSRTRLALAMIVVVIAALRFDWLFWLIPLLALVLGLVGTHEFCRMGSEAGIRISTMQAFVGTGALILTGLLPPSQFESVLVPIILLLLLASFITHMFLHGYRDAYSAVPLSFFAPMYVGLPLACALQVVEYDRIFFMFGLLLIWSSDIGAFYAGNNFGETKLAPQLSPKKTVEGAVGGLAACVLVALLFRIIVPQSAFSYGYGEVILLGLVIGVVAPLGDLAESVLKRDAGVKDSGSVLSGHGGVLDRLDSALFCFAVYYMFLVVSGRV